IWFEDMDRFGRGKLYAVLSDWERIISAGYSIFVGSLGRFFDSASSEMDKIAVIMKAILAHEESAKKAERLKKAWADKRKNANGMTKNGSKSSACPNWLDVSEDGSAYVLNERAATLRLCIQDSIDGKGVYTILRDRGLVEDASWRGLATVLRDRDKHLLG